jgi:hypothetical protein
MQNGNSEIVFAICYLSFAIALKAHWLALFLSFEDFQQVKK